MKFINLDILDSKIKSMYKPTPQDVLNLIQEMYKELK